MGKPKDPEKEAQWRRNISEGLKRFYADNPDPRRLERLAAISRASGKERGALLRKRFQEDLEYKRRAVRTLINSLQDPSVEARRKEKISKTIKELWKDPEFRRKIMEGRKRTIEKRRAEISEMFKKLCRDHPEWRERNARLARKYLHSSEIIKRRAETIKNNPEFREAIKRGALKRYSRPEEREKLSKRTKIYYEMHAEFKEYIKKKHIEWWNSLSTDEKRKYAEKQREIRIRINKERPELHPNFLAGIHNKFTSLERKVAEMLDSHSISYIQQYRVGTFWCDFALPFLKIILEVDGERWHQDMEWEKERDARILAQLGEGWKIIHIRERELMSDLELSKFLK